MRLLWFLKQLKLIKKQKLKITTQQLINNYKKLTATSLVISKADTSYLNIIC
jgi:hypothetical protein